MSRKFCVVRSPVAESVNAILRREKIGGTTSATKTTSRTPKRRTENGSTALERLRPPTRRRRVSGAGPAPVTCCRAVTDVPLVRIDDLHPSQERMVLLEDPGPRMDGDGACLDSCQISCGEIGVVDDRSLNRSGQVAVVVEGGVRADQRGDVFRYAALECQLRTRGPVIPDGVAIDVLDGPRGQEPLDERLVDVMEDRRR